MNEFLDLANGELNNNVPKRLTHAKLLVKRFEDYVENNYSNCNLTIPVICADIGCSKTYLHDLLTAKYNYSTKKYVEYFRIQKAIELIFSGTKNVYSLIGYKTYFVFYKSFLRVTGFNLKCFSAPELEKYKGIVSAENNIASKGPKEAIQFIVNNSAIKDILLEQKNKIKKPKNL